MSVSDVFRDVINLLNVKSRGNPGVILGQLSSLRTKWIADMTLKADLVAGLVPVAQLPTEIIYTAEYQGFFDTALNAGGIYYCNTEADITAALTAIGANGGTIIIGSGIITLTSPIAIDGGGNYIIKGHGNISVIDCDGNRNAFNITAAESCVLRDFKIDASDVSSSKAISINEGSDNPVLIDNNYIIGMTGTNIEVTSNNVTVKNCILEDGHYGINNSGAYCKYINNIITNPTARDYFQQGISSTGNNCLIHGNHIHSFVPYAGTRDWEVIGIYTSGLNCVITSNIIHDLTSADNSGAHADFSKAIIVYGDYSTISNNTIYNIIGGSVDTFHNGGEAVGIDVATADHSSICNNIIHDILGGDDGGMNGGNAYGIQLRNSDECAISGNIVVAVVGGNTDTAPHKGIIDVGTSDWNIYVINNLKGEGITVAGNSINAHNLT